VHPTNKESMNLFVGNTDFDWYSYHVRRTDVEELNFWRTMGNAGFSTLKEGELFFL